MHREVWLSIYTDIYYRSTQTHKTHTHTTTHRNVAWHALAGRQADMVDFYSQQALLLFANAKTPNVSVHRLMQLRCRPQ